MAIDIMVPQFGMSKSVKDLIVIILSQEWPLSARKVYNKIKRDYSLNMTYQAVYKALDQLIKQKVLIKKELEYSISGDWIDSLIAFAGNAKDSYSNTSQNLFGLSEFKQEGDMQTFVFSSLKEAEEYRKKLQQDYFAECVKKYGERGSGAIHYCAQASHLKSPVFFSEKSLSILKKIRAFRGKCYIAVRGDSPIDQWCANYYGTKWIKVKTGVNCASRCDFMAFGNGVVAQLYLPEKLKMYFDSIYKKNSISDIDIKKFFKEVYEKKSKVKLIIYRNKELAERLIDQTKSFFQED